jgi:hypothetical protein
MEGAQQSIAKRPAERREPRSSLVRRLWRNSRGSEFVKFLLMLASVPSLPGSWF